MVVFKIAMLGIVSAFSAMSIKESRNDIAITISVSAGILILIVVVDYLSGFITEFESVVQRISIDFIPLKYILKIVLIGLTGDFSCSIVEECGQKGLSDKIALAFRVIIVSLILPLIKELFEIIIKII